MRQVKASDFENGFKFNAAKLQAKREHKAKRDARFNGRGRAWSVSE